MYCPYCSVGKPLAERFDMQLSSACLFLCVELLQIGLRQLIQRYLPDFGNDVVVDAVFILAFRGDAERVSAVGLIPEVDLFTERHIRLYLFRDSAVLLFQRFKLIGTFRLCFRRYAFCNRQAFLIVFYDNSAFPTSVFSFP